MAVTFPRRVRLSVMTTSIHTVCMFVRTYVVKIVDIPASGSVFPGGVGVVLHICVSSGFWDSDEMRGYFTV